jgi:hypothetical protein
LTRNRKSRSVEEQQHQGRVRGTITLKRSIVKEEQEE